MNLEGGSESGFKIVGCSVGSVESTRLGEIASASNPLSSDWKIVGRSEGLGVSTRSGEISGDSNRLPEAAMLAQLDLGSKALELSPAMPAQLDLGNKALELSPLD